LVCSRNVPFTEGPRAYKPGARPTARFCLMYTFVDMISAKDGTKAGSRSEMRVVGSR